MEQQFRDRDRRLGSLEQSRDNSQNLWTYLPLVVALVVLIIVVTAAIASREQRQDAGRASGSAHHHLSTLPRSEQDSPTMSTPTGWPPVPPLSGFDLPVTSGLNTRL